MPGVIEGQDWPIVLWDTGSIGVRPTGARGQVHAEKICLQDAEDGDAHRSLCACLVSGGGGGGEITSENIVVHERMMSRGRGNEV